MLPNTLSKLLAPAALCCGLIAPLASATVVHVKTSQGDFDINLFDSTTPKTVANFLSYVEREDYSNVIVHRSVPGFVVQSGGYTYNPESQRLDVVAQDPAVDNEPELSNVRGTIAMAKLGSDPNSATSQWFFNLTNNAANLDNQNDGFTVFGVVMGDGMDVIDAIADLPVYNAGSPLNSLPLQSEPGEDETLTDEHFVIIESITVIDPNTDTNLELMPPKTTKPPTNGGDNGGNNGGSGGGGSTGLLALLALAGLSFRRLLNR
ncbi:peptidylprolyl isomerase [Neiella sp. HB171785]|uniref:Peptidyl-prolyl cis-trans isomerase n=1 Tax=Neiella litorisoli TaxID=2771431 RepID=A0A8J6UF17_9GAMM|nr:peptidylprolyl isomerase [Neiella litorisoli]MBD1390374.1 peptidylprolyl isomerase [Neiella litorisoli]